MRIQKMSFTFFVSVMHMLNFEMYLYNNIYNGYHNFYNMTDQDKFVYLLEFH